MGTNNEQKIANKKFDEILEALETKDKEQLTALFSKESLRVAEEFDSSVNELFDFFEGEVESYDDWGAQEVSTSYENDEIIQIIESTYDVKTTDCEYRFAIIYIYKDTADSDNVGVKSLYVIKKEDDIDPEYAYWGDGKNTPGININVQNEWVKQYKE